MTLLPKVTLGHRELPPPRVHSPTPAIIAACDGIDGAIASFLKTRKTVAGYWQYESTAEALNLFNLAIRHIEGLLALARDDLVLYRAACACARAAFETSAKAAWMVDTNDPFVREMRWLAHLAEEERVYERAAKRYSDLAHDFGGFTQHASQLKKFGLAVQARLPSGVKAIAHNPTLDQMLASFDGKQLYPLYIYLSQFVHGGHAATWIYRKGLGTQRRAGEFIDASDWYVPFRLSWLGLRELGSLMLWRLGARAKSFMPRAAFAAVDSAVERIRSGGTPTDGTEKPQ